MRVSIYKLNKLWIFTVIIYETVAEETSYHVVNIIEKDDSNKTSYFT